MTTHDAIEDAPKDLGPAGARLEIGDLFGADALVIVEGCTDADTDPTTPWLTREVRYISHAASA